MKAVVPVAGEGTRLRPFTFSIPKALILVAGKPVLNHILDFVMQWGPSELILVIGPGQSVLEAHLAQESPIPVRAVVQEQPLGLGHAVLQASSLVEDEPMLVVYGDTIAEADPEQALAQRADAVLGVKWHDDPRRFGIAELEGGRVARVREKPTEHRPGLVLVGVNYIANSRLLFACLEELVRSGQRTRGEFQATDAFQMMIEKGATVRTFPVPGWYDCGTPQSLLETQRALLGKGVRRPPSTGATLLPPVSVHPKACVEASVVGPYVTVAEGATVRRSVLSDCIIHEHAVLEGVVLHRSIVGRGAELRDQPPSLLVGDRSRLQRAPPCNNGAQDEPPGQS
jgi:glucose-1-phosphate thymidylyltransferase